MNARTRESCRETLFSSGSSPPVGGRVSRIPRVYLDRNRRYVGNYRSGDVGVVRDCPLSTASFPRRALSRTDPCDEARRERGLSGFRGSTPRLVAVSIRSIRRFRSAASDRPRVRIENLFAWKIEVWHSGPTIFDTRQPIRLSD